MLIRRRMMVESNSCPYITDGLIFWLDGINRGGVTGQWKDLIGGKVFTLNNCTESANGVSFNGSSSYGVYTGAISSNWQNETIEVTRAENTGTAACLFCPAGDITPIGIGLIMNSGKTEFSIQIDGSSVKRWRMSVVNWKRLSASAATAIKDGATSLTRASNDSWGKNTSGNTYLGCRYVSALSKYYSGKLHSIRIYNRKLTADEMKANQAVDAARFNIS